jgi:hypothetical protein
MTVPMRFVVFRCLGGVLVRVVMTACFGVVVVVVMMVLGTIVLVLVRRLVIVVAVVIVFSDTATAFDRFP